MTAQELSVWLAQFGDREVDICMHPFEGPGITFRPVSFADFGIRASKQGNLFDGNAVASSPAGGTPDGA